MDNKTQFLNNLFISAMGTQALVYANNILIELIEAVENPETPIERLVAIIERDPGLTATILKAANSSFYGLSKRVGTVKHAITVLGFKTLKNLLITQSIKKAFVISNADISINLWKHSLATGIAAKYIISINHAKYAEQAFIAGLLLDLGKFILMNFCEKEFQIIHRRITENPYQYSTPLEIEIFGVDHQDIGDFFTRKWLLPDSVSDAIHFHHSLDLVTSNKEIVAACALANNIAKAAEIGRSTSGLIEFLPHWIYSLLGLDPNHFEYIVTRTKHKYDELSPFISE